jgi:hypothetical protein
MSFIEVAHRVCTAAGEEKSHAFLLLHNLRYMYQSLAIDLIWLFRCRFLMHYEGMIYGYVRRPWSPSGISRLMRHPRNAIWIAIRVAGEFRACIRQLRNEGSPHGWQEVE